MLCIRITIPYCVDDNLKTTNPTSAGTGQRTRRQLGHRQELANRAQCDDVTMARFRELSMQVNLKLLKRPHKLSGHEQDTAGKLAGFSYQWINWS